MTPFNRGGPRRRRPHGGIPKLPVETGAKEPVMRRWPHPTAAAAPPAASLERIEARLHSLDCALERQTRLLTELREQLQNAAGAAPP